MNQKIELLELSPSALKPNSWNTNVVSPENEKKIEISLQKEGVFKPVIVRTLEDGSYEIIGGAHRTQAAIRMGLETIPVLNLGTIDDAEAKRKSLIDNGRYGADDALMLGKLLEELGTPEEIAEYMPYTEQEMINIFAATQIDLDGLDIDLGGDPDFAEHLPEPSLPKAQTHQTMTFQVPIEDAETVMKAIESIINTQGFNEGSSKANAGDALVWMVKNQKFDR